MSEIIFEVREDKLGGGYTAAALGNPIFTQADTIKELRTNVRKAVQCHFGDGIPGPMPKVIRLHFEHDEILVTGKVPTEIEVSEEDKKLEIWQHTERILSYIGGQPEKVREIRISETMSAGTFSGHNTLGLWVPETFWIVVKRSVLQKLEDYAGILLHETLHAKYGLSDVSRDFEFQLTKLCGTLAARIIYTGDSMRRKKQTKEVTDDSIYWQ